MCVTNNELADLLELTKLVLNLISDLCVFAFSLLLSVTGPVKEEDVLVLPLDSLKFDTHASAVQTVLDHFGQVLYFIFLYCLEVVVMDMGYIIMMTLLIKIIIKVFVMTLLIKIIIKVFVKCKIVSVETILSA